MNLEQKLAILEKKVYDFAERIEDIEEELESNNSKVPTPDFKEILNKLHFEGLKKVKEK